MTDRELLELAAKAAGIGFNDKRTSYPSPALYRGASGPVEEQGWWNPLANDGDALRLAVQLGLQITPGTYLDHTATAYGPHGLEAKERVHYQQDIYSATRRAIVRAAAAMAVE